MGGQGVEDLEEETGEAGWRMNQGIWKKEEVPREKKQKFRRIKRGEWKAMEEEDEEDRWIQLVETDKRRKMNLGFQVADVKRPLLAVKRITEKGNIVQFGPEEEDNFISNKLSGDKLMLRENGRGSYIMDVSFVGGGKTQITVDSAAEESVCPWEWGEQFGVSEADKWMKFRNASGGSIEHYGKRDVQVESSF